jgi:hypothetical protein
MSINNNGLTKVPSNTSTSLSKMNSALGGYGLQSNFGKQSNNEFQDLL